ncbi:MarR family winged helix-turn-helix transcriptional regulator [Prosthecomicrobium sp. N25]|uniref:MarR family winged helix-turn-helix transcriptional regulator n=1 Tax=Prosthecomicrobium sp. N25 TaxID=3129254 RepID=UPI0030776DAF
MADINFSASSRPSAAPPAGSSGPDASGEPHWEMIELLFFAYRDFIGDPDAILDEFGFGRAHHRVLHFVNRNPGMAVAELLDILKITKQSLGRVLRELVEGGYVEQQTGEADRRQRLLFATPKGRSLALRLAEPQSRRIAAALAALGPGGAEAAREFLRQMINDDERAETARFAARP